MQPGKSNPRSRRICVVSLLLGSAFQLGFLDSCNDRLVSLTTVIEPCGTFLANCNPGDFQTLNAPVGDFCVDPSCTVPGQCGNGQALGTIRQLCR